MADLVFNIALGRAVELYNRVDSNDPANSVIVVAAFSAADTDTVIKRVDDLAAITGLASTSEATNTGYARKILTDADIVAFAPDDVNDRMDIDIPDQTWTAVSAGTNWTDLSILYDSDSAAGTDANIVPMTWHDFVVSPNGGDITAQINVNGFFRAS